MKILKPNLGIFILSLVFILIPLIFFKTEDFWDGVSASYAFKTKDYFGFKEFLSQSASFIQFFLYKIFFSFSELLNISYKYLISIYYFFIIYFISIELHKISKNVLGMDGYFSFLPSIIFIVMPIWSMLISSIFITHLSFALLVLLGIKLYFHKNIFIKLFSIFILFCSYELKSNIFFSTFLCFLYENCKFNLNFRIKYKKTFYLFIYNILCFFIFNSILKTSGLWENHNSIINFLDWFNFKHFIWHAINYISFYLPLIFINILLIFYLRKKNLLEKFKLENLKNNKFIILFFIILLNISSVLPYLLVLKSTNLIVDDYSARMAILLTIAISLLISFNFTMFNLNNYVSKILKFYSMILIVFLSSLSIYTFVLKYNFNQFRLNLIDELKLIKINPGTLILNGNGIPRPIIISKESNYILWRAYNNAKWNSHIIKDKSIPAPSDENFFTNSGKYIYIANNYIPACVTRGEIITNNFSGINNFLKNIFYNNHSKLTIKITSTKCIDN